MTRIEGANVKFGDSFVLPIEKKEKEIVEAPEVLKLKEDLRLLNLEIEQAHEKKKQIIDEANATAENIIKEANEKVALENEEIAKKREEDVKKFENDMAQEAEKIRAESYQIGYDDGYQQGYVVITDELEQKIHAVDNFAKAQFDIKNNIVKSSEIDILDLVIEISKKICTEEVKVDSNIIKVLTENAIKNLKDKEDITIIINPQLLEVLNSISDKLKEDIPQLKSIKIIEDNSVSADGTIVESPLSRVDSRVKTQINEIAEKLYEAYNSEDENFESFVESLQDSDIKVVESIELSDDANIAEFLNELEDIPSFDDKDRDEDADYYANLDIDELKKAEEEVEINQEDALDKINLDDYEEEQQESWKPEIIEQNADEISEEVVAENEEEIKNPINEEIIGDDDVQ